MLKRLRIEAEGESYEEVVRILDAVQGMVQSQPSSRGMLTHSGAFGSVSTSWTEGASLVPDDYEIPTTDGEVIERHGSEYRGRRIIVFFPTAEEEAALRGHVAGELVVTERKLTQEQLARFTALATCAFTDEISFGPAKSREGWEIDLAVTIPVPTSERNEEGAIGWSRTFYGETFDDATEAAMQAVIAEVAGMTGGPVPDLFAPPPAGGDLFPPRQ